MSIVKRGNIRGMNLFSIGLISGLFTAIIAILFMIIYFLGERFGFTGVITLGTIDGFFAGESIIMFIIVLLGSIFLGSFLVLLLIRRTG
ncbi:hypothetical protein LCGC14_1017290 [marine sediment metagenome]|uniref:Uncharacterized protein n=1 Tax=marine sediment metagenome TaxID=412755 RepID=A0A0F9MYG4_9ZZZZ